MNEKILKIDRKDLKKFEKLDEMSKELNKFKRIKLKL